MATPNEARRTLPPDSPFWEKCARHQNTATTRNIAHLFLCDSCTIRLTVECFNNRPPIFHGDPLEGYCGLCNDKRPIALRQWFIDSICLNVVYSYPKSVAASNLVRATWASLVSPVLPHLLLEETDAVQIEPFVPGKRSAAKKASAIDFLVKDSSLPGSPTVFFIELKTGPSSLLDSTGMKEFQLDVNDYVDVVNVMRSEGKAAYVLHAQVTEEYSLPARRSIGRAIWWTDIFSLRSRLKAVRQRRGEDKYAGYYDPRVFRPIVEFPEELKTMGYSRLSERLRRQGIEDLPST